MTNAFAANYRSMHVLVTEREGTKEAVLKSLTFSYLQLPRILKDNVKLIQFQNCLSQENSTETLLSRFVSFEWLDKLRCLFNVFTFKLLNKQQP